jgi:hypothetical protein
MGWRKQKIRCPSCSRLADWRKVVGVKGKAIVDVHEDRHGELCGPHKIREPVREKVGGG